MWEDVASRLPVHLNTSTGRAGVDAYHPEYDGYDGKTTIKQADVALLGWPLDIGSIGIGNMTPAVRRADLDWYAPVTDNNGPAMTWGMHAVGLLEVGDEAAAAPFFNRSFANVAGPFAVWFEEPGQNGASYSGSSARRARMTGM